MQKNNYKSAHKMKRDLKLDSKYDIFPTRTETCIPDRAKGQVYLNIYTLTLMDGKHGEHCEGLF